MIGPMAIHRGNQMTTKESVPSAINLLFPLRGTKAWDERELQRRSEGKKCISMGSIPAGCAFGEPFYLEAWNKYGPNYDGSNRK